MENNQKISTVFGLIIIAILVVTLVIVNNIDLYVQKFESQRVMKDMAATIQHKNSKIKTLSRQLNQSMKSLTDVQGELLSVNQKIEAISKSAAIAAATTSDAPVDAKAQTMPAVTKSE